MDSIFLLKAVTTSVGQEDWKLKEDKFKQIIGRFQVTFYLCLEKSLREKPFMRMSLIYMKMNL